MTKQRTKKAKQLELPFDQASAPVGFTSIGQAATRIVERLAFKPYDENFHKNAPLADHSQPWRRYAGRGRPLPDPTPYYIADTRK
jgi:hypothetical protein